MNLPRSLSRALVATGGAAALAVGMLATVSASPAETTSYRECFTEDSGNTICYTIHDVEKLSNPDDEYSTPSRETGSMLIEYYDPEGNLIFSDKTRWHSFTVEKDGEVHVYHDQTKVTFEEDGESCTAVMNVNYANGETRHLGPEWEWVCK